MSSARAPPPAAAPPPPGQSELCVLACTSAPKDASCEGGCCRPCCAGCCTLCALLWIALLFLTQAFVYSVCNPARAAGFWASSYSVAAALACTRFKYVEASAGNMDLLGGGANLTALDYPARAFGDGGDGASATRSAASRHGIFSLQPSPSTRRLASLRCVTTAAYAP